MSTETRPTAQGPGVPSVTDEEGVSRPTRELEGLWRIAFSIGCGLYAAYYIYTARAGMQSPQAHRGIYVGGGAVLILLKYPMTKWGAGRSRPSFFDMALALGGIASFTYFVTQYSTMVHRAGSPTQTDIIFGVIAVLISLEITRRTTGWTLTILGIVALAYVFVGPDMPGLLRHGGYSFNRLFGNQFMTFNGVFGVVADIFATYVLLFVIFGTLLKKSGAAEFFVDLPYAIAGRVRGGPAKAALFVSALMGSISGSAVANVMTTGVFTIPVMRKLGYSREFSGGVETAASTGGQMLPPIMGAGAFIMAEFTGTPYSTIVLVSIIPAILYFSAVYFLIDFEALKQGLQGMDKKELEDPWKLFKDGWVNFVPVVVVFALIIMNYSPSFAAFFGIATAVVTGFFPYRGRRAHARDYVVGLADAGETSLSIAGIVGTIGVVIGVLNLTGLGLKFSDIIINVSGGNLFAALVLVTIASWVLGAGLTATSSYVIVAIIAGPALQQLGLEILVAHLIIFWVSQDANVTPPICVAAFAAASIADGRPMKTGFEAWKLARGLYIVPLLMAYSPLITGDLADMLRVGGTGLIGIYGFAAGMSGYLRRRTRWFEQIALFGGGIALIWPGWVTNLAGAVVLVAVWLLQRATPDAAPVRRRERRAAEEEAAERDAVDAVDGETGPSTGDPSAEPSGNGRELAGGEREAWSHGPTMPDPRRHSARGDGVDPVAGDDR
jgi:TRAP transporter 4TM/12TM fusion protein